MEQVPALRDAGVLHTSVYTYLLITTCVPGPGQLTALRRQVWRPQVKAVPADPVPVLLEGNEACPGRGGGSRPQGGHKGHLCAALQDTGRCDSRERHPARKQAIVCKEKGVSRSGGSDEPLGLVLKKTFSSPHAEASGNVHQTQWREKKS